VKTIKQTYKINAPAKKVWQALIDHKEIDYWGAGPATMDDKVGTEFSLWNGDIHGKNIEVVDGKKLVQEWFGGDWDEPSIATFTLSEKDGRTTIELHQTNVPDSDFDDIADGWKQYYLGPIKEYLEH